MSTSDGVLSIGEVARRTGVGESTLRAWERRHGLLEPERTDGGHRRYGLDDVERVRTMLQLVRSGWAAAAAAARIREQADAGERLEALVEATVGGAGERPAAPPEPAGPRVAAPLGGTDDDGTVPASPEGHLVDGPALAAGYRAALGLLHIDSPRQATEVLVGFVTELGGTVADADDTDQPTLPVDLSFGDGPPLLPVVPPMSIARMRLEFLLPELLEAARQMVDRLRREQLRGDG